MIVPLQQTSPFAMLRQFQFEQRNSVLLKSFRQWRQDSLLWLARMTFRSSKEREAERQCSSTPCWCQWTKRTAELANQYWWRQSRKREDDAFDAARNRKVKILQAMIFWGAEDAAYVIWEDRQNKTVQQWQRSDKEIMASFADTSRFYLQSSPSVSAWWCQDSLICSLKEGELCCSWDCQMKTRRSALHRL